MMILYHPWKVARRQKIQTLLAEAHSLGAGVLLADVATSARRKSADRPEILAHAAKSHSALLDVVRWCTCV